MVVQKLKELKEKNIPKMSLDKLLKMEDYKYLQSYVDKATEEEKEKADEELSKYCERGYSDGKDIFSDEECCFYWGLRHGEMVTGDNGMNRTYYHYLTLAGKRKKLQCFYNITQIVMRLKKARKKMQVKIKSLHMENFKGEKDATYQFDGKNVSVMGQNASGKSSIVDAVTWALFGVDSQWNAKFEIRPLDENGEKIHNIEISVCVVFEIDGKEKTFQRQLKENWVTKRGTSERTLQGNVGAYSVDDYPKSEKEYKECVAGIVSEDLFKILTSPTYFPGMKWQEQREILMRFMTDISDVELAGQDKRFADLISELEKAPSTDDIKKKYQKALNEWKKKQAELPVRIDEAEKQKVDIDVAELELLKNSLNEQIAENKSKQDDISKEFEEQQKASDGILELQFELNELQRKANEENNKKHMQIQNELDKENSDYDMYEAYESGTRSRIKRDTEKELPLLERRLREKQELWKSVNAEQIDENKYICPTCHRELSEEEKENILSNFEEMKKQRLEFIVSEGEKASQAVKDKKKYIEDSKKEAEEYEKKQEETLKRIEELEKQLSELPDSIDISDRPEAQEIQRKIAKKEAAMNKEHSTSQIRGWLKAEGENLQSQLTEVEKQLALERKNVEIDDRIAELRDEQRKTAQCVADQERMLFLLEEFIRYKMNMISDFINSKFDGVCFRLLELQINGGLKETCECMVDGVPYQSLNSGHRIVAGLKIIKALQEHYDFYPCVFVDNCESINSFNIPEMQCQIVRLLVSDDKEIKIEIDK